LLCHFLFYLVPGLLGMKTGLPLYVVGTSTYGVQGGFLMPGFLMGVLQFGWLAVNAFFASFLLCKFFGLDTRVPGLSHGVIAAVWAILGAFVGLKGIKYVGRVASFLPLIPLAVLVILLFKTAGGLGGFNPDKVINAGTVGGAAAVAKGADAAAAELAEKIEGALKGATEEGKADAPKKAPAVKADEKLPLTSLGVILFIGTYVVGFFATAGAAGADFGMNNRNAKDVQLGGLFGIALATIVAGGLAMLIVAGAYGGGTVTAASGGSLNPLGLLEELMGTGVTSAIMILLAISAFPPACFSAFIAANSFKTTLPKVNPFLSVGLGTLVSVVLAVTGWAGDVVKVFVIIGASFGPVCGAMAADYLLAGRKWAGPRASFNPAGWISWIVGFAVGAADFIPGLAGQVPCPPVLAFVVGFVLYFILAKAGLQTRTLEMPKAAQ
jgi:cytosine permease